MPITSLGLLGEALLRNGDAACIIADDAAALITYLVLYSHPDTPVGRPRLAAALWPDLTECKGRRRLSDLIYDIQKRMDPATIQISATPQAVTLRNIAVDVVQFRQHIHASSLAERCSAVDLYRGDLLESLEAEWIYAERAILRDRFLATLASVCAELIERGRLIDAIPMCAGGSIRIR
jgi:DNA-binding SARP family transcriptional activator